MISRKLGEKGHTDTHTVSYNTGQLSTALLLTHTLPPLTVGIPVLVKFFGTLSVR